MSGENERLWLPSAVARISVFLFFFSLLVLSLFLLGNFQSFLDSTQTMLLGIFESVSLLFVVSALYLIAVRIVLAVRRKQPLHIVSIVLSVLGVAFLSAAHLLFGFLIAWLKPLN